MKESTIIGAIARSLATLPLAIFLALPYAVEATPTQSRPQTANQRTYVEPQSSYLEFAYGSSKISPQLAYNLDYAVDSLLEYPDIVVEVAGHTDALEAKAFGHNLSLRRALSIYEHLISRGIGRSRLILAGYGDSRPIAPNTNENGSDNPDGRRRNRRVELNVQN